MTGTTAVTLGELVISVGVGADGDALGISIGFKQPDKIKAKTINSMFIGINLVVLVTMSDPAV